MFLLCMQNTRKDKVGTLCSDYTDVMKMTVIGEGFRKGLSVHLTIRTTASHQKREKGLLWSIHTIVYIVMFA